MRKHINQALQNEAFLADLNKKFPKEYFDWKTTALFYIALHYVLAYAASKRKNIGNSHREMLDNSNPAILTATNPLRADIYTAYNYLYKLSRTARYIAFDDERIKNLTMQTSYLEASQYLSEIKKYFISQKLMPK
jgi:hypothetical protein